MLPFRFAGPPHLKVPENLSSNLYLGSLSFFKFFSRLVVENPKGELMKLNILTPECSVPK